MHVSDINPFWQCEQHQQQLQSYHSQLHTYTEQAVLHHFSNLWRVEKQRRFCVRRSCSFGIWHRHWMHIFPYVCYQIASHIIHPHVYGSPLKCAQPNVAEPLKMICVTRFNFIYSPIRITSMRKKKFVGPNIRWAGMRSIPIDSVKSSTTAANGIEQ